MDEESTPVEVLCDQCDGKGFTLIDQPTKPGRRIYQGACTKCGGKGRIAANEKKKPKGPIRGDPFMLG
jgi:DnaJ-class molecular chaperone